MAALRETLATFSLNKTERSSEEHLGSRAAGIPVPKLQAKKGITHSQPFCSGLYDVKSRSKLKGRKAFTPPIFWNVMVPKRGVSKLILWTVASTEKNTGVSLQALKKTIAATGYKLEKHKNYLS